MSVDHSAIAVIGVRLEKVYTKKYEKTHVTKYNQDTGEPYQQEVKKTLHFWGDKEVEEPYCNDDFVTEMCGLELCESGYGDAKVVGRRLGEADPGKTISFSRELLAKTWDEVEVALRKSGYKGDVEFHLVAYVG